MADYSLRSDFVKQLDRDILEFVHRGIENRDGKRFNQLALREFELQYHTIEPYRRYCKKKGISPKLVSRWEEIPAVSSFAFKKILLSSSPAKKAEDTYLMSGVVDVKNRRRGPIYPDKKALELMNTANGLLAKAFLFPDVEKMKMLLMVPSPKMAPGMVMASGSKHIKLRFGTPDSLFLISFRGLNLKTLLSALRQAEENQQSLTLIGATSGFDYFFNACEKDGIRFNLPKGSRICDSGGYMGRYTRCSKEEYLRKCREILDVEGDFCINALWICESSTVYFDNVLKNSFSGVKKGRCKEVPPWCKIIVVDPRDFKRLPKGKIGLLRHYDLTNRAMAFAVQTDKVGFETEDGFEVMGKWDKNIGKANIDYSAPHPGGRMVTQAMDYFMRRKLSNIRKIYSCLK